MTVSGPWPSLASKSPSHQLVHRANAVALAVYNLLVSLDQTSFSKKMPLVTERALSCVECAH